MKLNIPTLLIGLTGANGAGKDTAALQLQRILNTPRTPTIILAFGDALYAEVAQAFQTTPQALKDRRYKEMPLQALALQCSQEQQFAEAMLRIRPDIDLSAPRSPRQILQWWATEYRRSTSPNYWVDKLQCKVLELRDAGTRHVIVTDVRFANEAQALRELGGRIWCIERTGLTPTGTGHVSEVTGQEFDPEVTISNRGSVGLLRTRLAMALLDHRKLTLRSAVEAR